MPYNLSLFFNRGMILRGRSRGEVSAGARIFPPPRLLIQEPRGQRRQGPVMMPPDPIPHLIAPRAGLALGSLQAFLLAQVLEAERAWQGCLALPIYPSLTDDETDYICRQLWNLLDA